MSTVDSATNANVIASLNSKSSSGSSNSSAADLQNNFLTMLTTQLQNQDPLNPMENSQMTSQLAQISTLEGIQGLNTTLTSLLASYNTSQALQASSAIGSQVLVEGNKLALSSGLAQGGATLASAADKITVTIRDSAGKVVQTQDLGKQSAGTVAFTWDGKNASDKQLADGNYTFSIEASSNGAKVSTTPIQVGTVNAVVKSGSSFVLELTSGETVAFDNVLQFM
jgi:flagellar basal-body rod modification protein FlgD